MQHIKELIPVGGYLFKEPWARGTIGIDWRTMTAKMAGHIHGQRILTYDLANAPPLEEFAELYPTVEEWGWWPDTKADGITAQYANGLWFDGTNWWAVCRAHYDTEPRWDMDVYRDDGVVWTIPLAQQKFSGFVKLPPDADLISWAYFGCGGYESGQGTCSGPTFAEYDGTVHLEHIAFNMENPGPNLEYWNGRSPRRPDYIVGSDTWVGWKPRRRGGVIQGRWASDWLYGGGVILPDGPLCYFPYQGTGQLHYDWNPPHFDQRTITFAEGEWANRSCLLAYDPNTYKVVEFNRLMEFWGPIRGQEIDPQGRLWLAHGYGHGDAEVAIRVYEIVYKEAGVGQARATTAPVRKEFPVNRKAVEQAARALCTPNQP